MCKSLQTLKNNIAKGSRRLSKVTVKNIVNAGKFERIELAYYYDGYEVHKGGEMEDPINWFNDRYDSLDCSLSTVKDNIVKIHLTIHSNLWYDLYINLNKDYSKKETVETISTQEINNINENLTVEITYNEDKNGIELRFSNKPTEEVRMQLKSNGFRYSKPQNLWWAKQSDERIRFAEALVHGLNNIESIADEAIENVEIIGELEEVTTDIETIEQPVQIQPLSIENIEDQNIRVQGIFASLNKNNTIEEYKGEVERKSYISTCKITDIITLSPEDYEIFTHNFLTDYDFIAGKGGTNSDFETDKQNYWELTKEEVAEYRKSAYNLCVLIQAKGKESILVDPQGYNYSRYVAFIDGEIKQDKEPVHEGAKIININKNITTNSIDSNTTNTIETDTTDTKDLTPNEAIKQLFKDALNELIEDQLPQFKHEIKYKKAKVIDFGNYKQRKA